MRNVGTGLQRIDSHDVQRIALKGGGVINEGTIFPVRNQKLRQGYAYHVPYRSILPEKVDGLLTAGRCISASHVAMAAGKSMGNCVATGHAAGIAAAMSAKKGIVPREVKVAQLQDALREDGVDLDVGGKKQVDVSTVRGV